MFNIFVNNQQLDIPDKNFSVTLELADTLNLEGGKSSKSTSIDIPLNVNNENILDLTRKFVDAELISGWFSIRGILYFLEIKKEINRKTLKAQFVWQTGTFVENNKNKLLSDLDIPVSFTYNYTTLTNSWNNTEKYVFDFCSRGKRIEEYNTAYAASDLKPFHLVEFFPAIRLTEILKAIFKGYTFSSDFITNNPDYFLLFTQDKEIFNTKEYEKYNTAKKTLNDDYAHTTTVPIGSTFIFTPEVTIPFDKGMNGGIFDDADYKMKLLESGTGRMIIAISVKLDRNNTTAASSSISVNLKKGALTISSETYRQAESYQGVFIINTSFREFGSGEYYITINAEGSVTNTHFGASLTMNVYKISGFNYEASSYMGSNKVIDNLSYFLPKIEQLKFLKGLIQMFNLYILIDENQKKVFIDKKSDFYSKSAIDYTDYIDISKEIVNEIQQEKIVKLGLKLDNSDSNQKEENSFNTYFYNDNGETQENINEIFSATTMGKNSTDDIICPVLHAKEIGTNPYYYSDEYRTKFDLRIVKYEGLKTLFVSPNYQYFKIDFNDTIWTNDIEIKSQYPLFTSYGGSENLVFNTQNGLSGLESNFTESLQQIVNGEKITFEAILPIDILTNLMLGGVTGDLRYPIYIGISPFEGYYEIQKVENITGYSNRVKIEALKKFENTYITK